MSEERSDSQCAAILADLKKGRWMTPLEALKRHQCFRLAARIRDLRKEGHEIDTVMHKLPGGKRVARYVLVRSRAA
jgi:hypothetical protein